MRGADVDGVDVLTNQHASAQVASDQVQQPLVVDASSQQTHQHVVIDRVEGSGNTLPLSKSPPRSCVSCGRGMLSRGKTFEYSAVASVHLVLVLPDESRSLIPARWTDWEARTQTTSCTLALERLPDSAKR